MNELDYKSNSHKSKETDDISNKKITKIASGKIKKKSGFSKITEALISDDFSSVKEYIIKDVIIPASKDLINKIVSNGISMILYGDASRSRPNSGQTSYRYSYNTCYIDNNKPRTQSQYARSSYQYDDVVFETRGDAEGILESMEDLIERYSMASIADFYEFAGITGKFTDHDYGWTNLRDAEVIRVSDGYMIRFPKAIPLK